MIISEHVVKLDMVGMRRGSKRKIVGKQIKAVMKYIKQMKKKGYEIQSIKPKERGYTGKGLFYGIRVLDTYLDKKLDT